MLTEGVSKGHLGGSYMMGDSGKVEMMKEVRVHSKKIPSFVLANSRVQADAQGYQDRRTAVSCRDPVRDKMRPDLMLVEMTDEQRTTYLRCRHWPRTAQLDRSHAKWQKAQDSHCESGLLQ